MIACEKCGEPVPASSMNTAGYQPCTACGVPRQIHVFNAAARNHQPGKKQQPVISVDEAGCFYHPAKKAVAHCETCGRFLCALCDIEENGTHQCFSCLAATEEKKEDRLETSRFLPDGLAIRVSLIPPLSMVFLFFTCITAPFCIYFVIRHWNSPSSITPRRKKLRFVLAFLFSLLQVAAWTGIILSGLSG